MDKVKRRLSSDDLSEEKPKQFRNSITCFEDLSNDLLCEIFDYLDGHELNETFSNLNFRIEQFLRSSTVLLKTHFFLFKNGEMMNMFKQFMLSNRHQIFSIYVTFLFRVSSFFSSFLFDSSFAHLESIFFKDIQSDTLIPVLSNLSSLPCLCSLTIETSNVKEEISEIYRLIFILPKLKYYRLSLSYHQHHSITLPMALNNQFSPIEYLVINHYCSLNELLSLISYTPQLRRLTLHKTKTNDSTIQILSSMILVNLKSIYLDLCQTPFNEWEIFITKISPNLKSLLIIGSKDITFLDAHRWEQLILNSFPQLEKFYLIYDDKLDNEQKYPIYPGRLNEFSSSFWIERQWLLEAEVRYTHIEYTIRPFSKRWYNDTKDTILDHPALNSLTFQSIHDPMFEEIQRVLTITQIYYLEIVEKKVSIPVLIQAINLLSDLNTLKIHSLSPDETIELTVKELLILFSMKQKSQITRVYFEEIADVQELDFIFIFCPSMKYFKVGSIRSMDIQSFLRTIFKQNNHHLHSLCFSIPTADDQIIKNIEQMIKGEQLLPHFTIKRNLDTIYLQWK